MKEHPILFSGAMVKAILDGRKSQTRRIVKAPKCSTVHGRTSYPDLCHADPSFRSQGRNEEYLHWAYGGGDHGSDVLKQRVFCPYTADGCELGRLWVRETFAPSYFGRGQHGDRADWTSPDGVPEPRWKPSIFMRQSESRITLEVTSVRVERLQAISERDATAEGCTSRTYRDGRGVEPATLEYRQLWDRINGKRAPWKDNPWVWAIEFRRVDHAYVAEMTIQEGADVEGGP